MSKLGILGASALSLTLAVAVPALAAERGGMRGGGGGGRMQVSAGPGLAGGSTFRGAQTSVGPGRAGPAASGPAISTGTRFGNAQASIGPGRTFNSGPTVSSNNFVGRTDGRFTQGFRGDRDRRFGRGFGFAAGLAAGSTLGYGYYDPYYYDDYAYDDYSDPGYVVSSAVDPTYCAQRYRSYDPASGTYLGYDGLRHPCGQ